MPTFSRNVNLSPFTTIRIGGIASYFFEPKSLEELKYSLLFSLEKAIPIFVLGRGSNTIFGNFHGLVLSMRAFDGVKVIQRGEKGIIIAQAGVKLSKLISLSVRENWEGLYRLVGFPATVGGAVAMNAGAFGYEISQNLREVVFINWEGRIERAKREDLEFSYRSSPFPKLGIVLSALFEVSRARERVREEYKRIKDIRLSKQPINMPTCGSTFKNPAGDYAGRLLEKVGMKGYRIGDVAFSEKHANFLVNLGRGSYEEVIKIIQEAKRRVFESFGIKLEEEVKLIESSGAYGRAVY